MRQRNKWNYRVWNDAEHCGCGHHHHSKDSALRCMRHLGWEGVSHIEQYRSGEEEKEKRSLHAKEQKHRAR